MHTELGLTPQLSIREFFISIIIYKIDFTESEAVMTFYFKLWKRNRTYLAEVRTCQLLERKDFVY